MAAELDIYCLTSYEIITCEIEASVKFDGGKFNVGKFCCDKKHLAIPINQEINHNT